MSAATVLARGRAKAESLMVDACTVQHATALVTDQETGVVTPTYTTVYTGKCKVQMPSAETAPRTTDVGEASVLVGHLVLHLPMSVTTVSPNDLVTVTSSGLDAGLVGRTFRLRGPSHKTYLTARRFPIIEVTS
jgi:hypothetical protein